MKRKAKKVQEPRPLKKPKVHRDPIDKKQITFLQSINRPELIAAFKYVSAGERDDIVEQLKANSRATLQDFPFLLEGLAYIRQLEELQKTASAQNAAKTFTVTESKDG